jgi:hypothetical protein
MSAFLAAMQSNAELTPLDPEPSFPGGFPTQPGGVERNTSSARDAGFEDAIQMVNLDAAEARKQQIPLHALYCLRQASWRAQQISRSENFLASEHANAEATDAFLDFLAAHPAHAVDLARRADGLVVLNADDFVGLSPRMRAASIEEGPAVYAAIKAGADAVRHAAFHHQLSASTRGTVLFTAGGPGSGKSTLAQFLIGPAWIYDSVLPDLPHAEDLLRRALEHGHLAEIMLVVRSPAAAMRANLSRAFHEKRLAAARKLARSHVRARATVQSLARTYAGDGRVRFRAVAMVEGGDSHPIPLSSVPALDLTEATEEALTALHRIEGGLDPEWKQGLLPRRIQEAANGTISCD